jgi:hypothetical protein
MSTAAPEKTVMLRGVDRDLWDAVRDQAKRDGMYLKAWIERALRRELAQAKKDQE